MTRRLPGILAFSDRLYRRLLWLYPAEHRREYGALMAQVFRDQCHAAYRRASVWGVLWVWLPLVVDLAVTLIEEHRRKGFSMSKESFARFSGPLLMLGGLAWALSSYSQFQPGSHYVYWGIYRIANSMIVPGFLLTGVGLIGVQMRYGSRLGRPGQVGLAEAVLGAFVAAACMILVMLGNNDVWNTLVIAAVLHFFGLVITGIAILQSATMGRHGWIPVVMGVVMLIYVAVSLTTYPTVVIAGFQPGGFLTFLVIGLGWITFGSGVLADQRKPQVTQA